MEARELSGALFSVVELELTEVQWTLVEEQQAWVFPVSANYQFVSLLEQQTANNKLEKQQCVSILRYDLFEIGDYYGQDKRRSRGSKPAAFFPWRGR